MYSVNLLKLGLFRCEYTHESTLTIAVEAFACVLLTATVVVIGISVKATVPVMAALPVGSVALVSASTRILIGWAAAPIVAVAAVGLIAFVSWAPAPTGIIPLVHGRTVVSVLLMISSPAHGFTRASIAGEAP